MPEADPAASFDPADDLTAQRALIVVPPASALPATMPAAPPPALAEAMEDVATEVCIIPGSGVPEVPALAPRRRRGPRAHVWALALALCGLLAALLSFAPLTEAAGGQVSPFNALASALLFPTPRPYFDYHVQAGDTFESIAAHFKVQLNGIYELNHLYAGQEAQGGELIRVPTDPQYGASYQAPALPMQSAGAGIGMANYNGTCLFCSVGGWTNGPGRPCAAGSLATPVDPTKFALINPNPNSRWVRGFTWYHNGVDITSMQFGTPVLAAQTGVVIFAGWDPFGAGYAVKINHCGGLATAYGHMEKLLVSLGQSVTVGQEIGLQGSTGDSTGPHVHFMTWWDNVPFDPLCVYASLDGMHATSHYGGCPAPQTAP